MRLKLFTANIALGLPRMDNLLTNVKGHLVFHRGSLISLFTRPTVLRDYEGPPNPKRVRYVAKHSDLTRTLALIKEEDPDVVALNEVILQSHKEKVEQELSSFGYSTLVWGPSHHYPDSTIASLVASKAPGAGITIDIPEGKHAGAGGGAAALRLHDAPITIVAVHLSASDKCPWLYGPQLAALRDLVRRENKEGRQTVLLGDWNASASYILKHPSFAGLDLVNAEGDLPTCPTFLPSLKPLDHIFIPKEWKSGAPRGLNFGSDHLAVAVEVEVV